MTSRVTPVGEDDFQWVKEQKSHRSLWEWQVADEDDTKEEICTAKKEEL